MLALPTAGRGEAPAADASPALTIKVLADNEEYDWATQRFKAEGNVRVTYGETLLTADTVLGNPFTGEVEAAGNVVFQNGGRSLTGESFSYNYKTSEGVAGNASGSVDNIYFRGEELRSAADRYTLKRSRFTTCDDEHPHYYMSAREMEIAPGKKLTARDVAIYLYGNKLISIPKYSVGLDKKDRGSGFTLPELGVSGRYGAFAGYNFDLTSGPNTIARLDARISTKHLLTGGLEYDRIAGQPIFLRATYRQPYYAGGKPYTLLTRLPELGIRYGSQGAFEAYSKPGHPLDLARGFVDPRQLKPGLKSMNIIGEVGAGKFIEHPNRVSSERLDTRLIAWMDPIAIAPRTVLSPAVSARFSHYGGGEDYNAIGYRLGIGRQLGKESYASLTYITHSIHGSTPFDFDRVEIPQELAGRVEFPLGSFFLEIGGRYDLARGLIYDTEVSIAKRLHCLEPKLTWRNRFQQFSMDVRVLGF